MIDVYPYTCWNPTYFMNNAMILCAKMCFKHDVAPVTTIMIDSYKKNKKMNKTKNAEWLAYLRLTIDVVHSTAINNNLNSTIIRKLIDAKPDTNILSKGTQMIVDSINAIIRALKKSSSCRNNKNYIRALMVSCFSYIKHSGDVYGSVRDDIKAKIHACNTTNDYIQILEDYHTICAAWNSSSNADHTELFNQIIGITTDDVGDSSTADIEEIETDIDVYIPTLADSFKNYKKNDRAIILANSVDADMLMCNDSNVPCLAYILTAYFAYRNIDVDINVIYRDMIRHYLENWTSSVDAIDYIVKMIQSIE
jgi:hypothetical protein